MLIGLYFPASEQFTAPLMDYAHALHCAPLVESTGIRTRFGGTMPGVTGNNVHVITATAYTAAAGVLPHARASDRAAC